MNIYRGVLTGLNEAFIIDGQKREEILNNCQTHASTGSATHASTGSATHASTGSATHASTGSATTDTQEWERQIDRLVYKLYDLTEEEIRIVEK